MGNKKIWIWDEEIGIRYEELTAQTINTIPCGGYYYDWNIACWLQKYVTTTLSYGWNKVLPEELPDKMKFALLLSGFNYKYTGETNI